MPTSNTFYPSLSTLVRVDQIPKINLGLVQNGIDQLLKDIFYKDLILQKSRDGAAYSYSLTLVAFDRLAIEIPGTDGLALVFNPGDLGQLTTEIPIRLEVEIPLLKYFPELSIDKLQQNPFEYFLLLVEILGLTKAEILTELTEVFLADHADSYQYLYDVIENNYGAVIQASSGSDPMAAVEQIGAQLEQLDLDVLEVVYDDFISDVNGGIDEVFSRLELLFSRLIGQIKLSNLLELIKPKILLAIDSISLALEFPRKMLTPLETVDDLDNDPATLPGAPLPEPFRSRLTFDVGSLSYSTSNGLQFIGESNLQFTYSQIGKTGFTLKFDQMQLDLSRTQNLPDAAEYGYPNDSIGVYVKSAEIGLPAKWFKQESGSTAMIYGENLYVGTGGGVSGIIGIKASITNPPTGTNDPELLFTLGAKPASGNNPARSGFQIGFKKFELEFKQNSITSSTIEGFLIIPGFKDSQGNAAKIEISLSFQEDGDFKIVAKEATGIKIEIPDVFALNITQLAVGKEEGRVYVGIMGSFTIVNTNLSAAFKYPIEIKKLIVWDDGQMEFVGGGTVVLPKPASLKLGPAEIAVTALHFGSHEQFHIDQIRKYLYFGFDGGISTNPNVVSAKGSGIKLFFTVDNGGGKPSHVFIRVESIRVDIILAANASPSTAAIMLSGWLSMQDTPSGREYIGGIALSIPKVKIEGLAAMRLNPKVPAFLIDIAIELPVPIVLGAGLELNGFRGLVGNNYVASQTAAKVPVEPNWYPYYKSKIGPEFKEGVQASKFEQRKGFALGAGVTISTIDPQPKKAFTAKVFFLLSLPDVFLLQGQMAVVKEKLSLTDPNDPPISFMLAITKESITVGAGINYVIKEDAKILDLQAQIEMAFFFKNANAWYVNIGTDVNPVKGLILKDALSFEVYAYLMLSGSGIRTGAGISFEKSYSLAGGVLAADLSAYFDTVARINFKPRQFGGAIQLGGRVALRAFGVGINITAALSMAAEVSNPFFITGFLEACIEINLWVKKFEVCGKIEFTWIFDKTPNTEEVTLHEGGDKGGKARHLVTNETYSLYYSAGASLPSPANFANDNFVIPMDCTVEFEFSKPVRAGSGVQKIGGPNGGGSSDKVPQIKGKLDQVAHDFMVDQVDIYYFDNGSNNWQPYDIYDALSPLDNSGISVGLPAPANRFNGFWQLTNGGDKVNRLAIMAQSPLEWTRQGNTPLVMEDLGITASDIFCPPEANSKTCLNFDAYTSGNFPKDQWQYHKKMLFRIVGQDGLITTYPNPYGVNQALVLPEGSSLEILFTEPTACVNLSMLSCTETVKVRYERKTKLRQNDLNGAPQYTYALYKEQTLVSASLVQTLEFLDNNQPIDRILILPGPCRKEEPQGCTEISPEATALLALLNELVKQNALLSSALTEMLAPPYLNIYTPYLQAYNANTNTHYYTNTGNPDQGQGAILVSRIGRNCDLTLAFNLVNPPLKYDDIVEFSAIQPDLAQLAIGINNAFIVIALMADGTFQNLKGTSTCFPICKTVSTGTPSVQPTPCENATRLVAELQVKKDKLLTQVRTLEKICARPPGKPCLPLHELVCHDLEILKEQIVEISHQIEVYTTFISVNCDLANPPNGAPCNCQTQLFKICWLTKEQLDYNNNLPPFSTLVQNTQAMIEAINLSLKPVFRPDTVYLIQLKVRDQMSQASGSSYTNYHNYGFRTKGPVGHFHSYRSEYTQLVADKKEDQFTLAKLKPYVDFDISFPNADGSLTNAKPLFYDCPKLLLFFVYPHVYTMYQSFNSYNGNAAVSNSLDVLIKDPIEPHAANFPVLKWTTTSFSRQERDVQILNNFLNGQDCVQVSNLQAQGMSLEMEACGLKPLKLYTAIYQASFNGEARDVLSYPFATSRYACFKEQVESYLIKDEAGQLVRTAFFDMEKAFDATVEIGPAMAIATATISDTDPLNQEFMHPYDRIIDGALRLTAFLPAETTDFTMIRDSSIGNPTSGKVIGMLVRNIEPFNDPKLKSPNLEDTIRVVDGSGAVDPNYTLIISKDGSKAFITNAGFDISDAVLNLRFRFLLWNGQNYALSNPAKDEVEVQVDIFPPTTQLKSAFCGIAGLRIDETIEADTVLGASAYEFLIEDASAGFSETYLRRNTDAKFPLFEVFGLKYGRSYQVRVRPVITGRITAFGPACTISTDTLSFIILSPAPAVQGITAKIEIEVRDSAGQLVTDYEENVSLNVNGSATTPNNGLVNIVGGRGIVWVNDKIAETVLLSLSDTEGTGLDVSSTEYLVFGIAPATAFEILDPPDTLAGTTVAVVIQAINQFGLVDPAYQKNVSLLASGNALVAGSGLVDIINGTGSVQLSDNTPETVQLSLLDSELTGLKHSSTQEIIFSPAPAVKFVLVPPTVAYQGIPASLIIEARIPSGTVDGAFNQAVTLLVSGNASILGGGLVSLVNGTTTVKIVNPTAETITLSLSDTQATGLDVSDTQQLAFAAIGCVFRDTFTEATDTQLDLHTPDLGSSWALLIQESGALLKTNAPDGTLVKQTPGGVGKGCLYTANTATAYSNPDYAIEARQVKGSSSINACVLAIRILDANNMYAVRFNTDASQLYKKIAGVWTALGPSGPGTTNGAIVKLEVAGNLLRFFNNYTELLSATDTDITAAGLPGVGMGAVILPGDRLSNQELDQLRVCLAAHATPVFLDTFTGSGALANQVPERGLGWTKLLTLGASTGIEVSSGTAARSGTGINLASGSFYTANVPGGYPSANYEVELKVVVPGSATATTSLGVRVQNAGQDGYFVRFNANASKLYVRTAGVWTPLGLTAPGVDLDAIVRLQISGNDLRFFVNEKLIIQETVTTHVLPGEAGMGIGAVMELSDKEANQRLNDFAVQVVV